MKVIKHIYILPLLLALISCSDEFLDKNPQDKLSSGNFWQSASDGELALAGCYSQFQAQGYANNTLDYWVPPTMQQSWDELTDNAYGARDNGFRDLVTGNYNPNGDSKRIIKTLYPVSYNAINSCNLFLEKVDGLSSKVSEAQLNAWKGEVLFLRSYAYYFLAITYGDVPLRLESTTVDNLFRTKNTREEVFAQCIADLTSAIGLLPEAAYNGHVKKAAALALKAKILLYIGNDFAEVANATKQIIDSQMHTLHPNYSEIFIDGSQEGNSEIIYSVKMNSLPGECPGGKKSHQNVIARWGNLHPTQEFIDFFECTDGKPITESPLYDPNNPALNRDPRMAMTIREQWLDEVEIKPSFGFVFVKGLSESFFESPQDVFNDGTDYVQIRYADVLLMYAEAMIEQGNGGDPTVLEALNKVRARAYGVDYTETDHYPSITTTSTDELRATLRYERRVELSLENSRFFDLRRWGLAESVLNGFVGDPVNNRVYLEKHDKWPLPQSALDQNSKLVQNPNY